MQVTHIRGEISDIASECLHLILETNRQARGETDSIEGRSPRSLLRRVRSIRKNVHQSSARHGGSGSAGAVALSLDLQLAELQRDLKAVLPKRGAKSTN